MKKTALVLVFIQLLGVISALFSVCASAGNFSPVPREKVKSICVYNVESDTYLYRQNPEERLDPASTVKMMTGFLAIELFKGDYEKEVEITKELLGSFQGKSIGLKAGEVIKIKELLHATICFGANDAANVLAGLLFENNDHSEFVKLMNSRAAAIGMKSTHYTNAYGYSESGMYTTAEDVVILADYVSSSDMFMDMCSEVSYVIPATNKRKAQKIFNSNYLVTGNDEKRYRNPAAIGMSAGKTPNDETVLVTMTQKNGMTNIFVLLGGSIAGEEGEHNYIYETANDLIKWSEESFSYRRISDSSKTVREIKVNLSSDTDHVIITPDRTIDYILPTDLDLEKDLTYEITVDADEIDAPVEAGQKLGKMVIKNGDKTLAEVDLVTKNAVDRNGFLYILARTKKWTETDTFKYILLSVAGLTALFVVIAVAKSIFRKKDD